MLGRHQGRDQAQEAFQFMPGGKGLQARGAARKNRGEIGQANGIALGRLAQNVFADTARRVAGAVAQGLPTSWRNHLR